MCRATVTLVKYNTGNAERAHEKETDREKERKREEGEPTCNGGNKARSVSLQTLDTRLADYPSAPPSHIIYFQKGTVYAYNVSTRFTIMTVVRLIRTYFKEESYSSKGNDPWICR